MLRKHILATALLSLAVSTQVNAVSLDIGSDLDRGASAPVESTFVLDQGATTAIEPEMGVLVIPLEQDVAMVGAVGDSANDASYIGSLGFARVPLPAAAWLFGTAIIGIIAVSRRRPGRDFG